LLETALEATGLDFDSAVKSLNELCLDSALAIPSVSGSKSVDGLTTAIQPSAEGTVSMGYAYIAVGLYTLTVTVEV
jgi:hypothetical protein